MRFKKVVLPAPLAPTIPTSSPCLICTLIVSAAFTMPNHLVKSIVCRIGSVSGTLYPFRPSPKPGSRGLLNRPQPSRLEQNDEQHDDPQDHLPGIGGILGGIGPNKLKGN